VIKRRVFCTVATLWPATAFAQSGDPRFDAFLRSIRAEALKSGVDAGTLDQALGNPGKRPLLRDTDHKDAAAGIGEGDDFTHDLVARRLAHRICAVVPGVATRQHFLELDNIGFANRQSTMQSRTRIGTPTTDEAA
jgi:hypothetical protein